MPKPESSGSSPLQRVLRWVRVDRRVTDQQAQRAERREHGTDHGVDGLQKKAPSGERATPAPDPEE